MITTTLDLAAFAMAREERMNATVRTLLPLVEHSITIEDHDERTAALIDAAEFAISQYSDDPTTQRLFLDDVRSSLSITSTESSAELVATWLTTAAIGAAAFFDATDDDHTKTWVTMLDEAVRDSHFGHHAETIAVTEPFDIDGYKLQYPGQPVGPPEVWINCRCVIAVAPPLITASAAEEDDEEPPVLEGQFDYDGELEPMEWHAVLTVEGVESGDGRSFDNDALSWRDLPLPLEWQKVTAEHHQGSVIVGRMDGMTRHAVDEASSQIRSWGVFTANEDADAVIGHIGEKVLRGISPTVDAHTSSFDADSGTERLSRGRICSGTIVNVPAFAEAYIALGPPPEDWLGGEDEGGSSLAADAAQHFVSDKAWGQWSASDYTPEQWRRATLVDTGEGDPDSKSRYKLPVREPGGALNRNGVHAAAAALAGARGGVNISPEKRAAARRKLRGLYRQIGETPPESLAAAAHFRRGPGWVTHPRETARLHRYWTRGRGAAKIGWGAPHDFYRCRRQLAKYIAPRFLSRVCAQWHHDALGIWPGQHAGERRRGHAADIEAYEVEGFTRDCVGCETLALVASAAVSTKLPSRSWFGPQPSNGPTAIDVDKRSGQLWGYLAQWGTCHIGLDGECVQPPHSLSSYAYFNTGVIETDEGEIPCGVITMNTGHADLGFNHRAAVAHYDDTGLQVARVVAGEDEHGIWVAGQALPVGEGDYARFRAAALSGDWRRIAGNLELVAALAVNVPGFPVPRAALAASGGVRQALVAINPVVPDATALPSADEIATMVVKRMRDSDKRNERVRALRRRVNGPRAAAIVAAAEAQ